MVNYNFIAGRSSGFPTPPPVVATYQQDAPGIFRFGGGGSWVTESYSGYYAGSGARNETVGAFYEVTIPSGFTRCVLEGLKGPYGTTSFEIQKNGGALGTGNCRAGGYTLDLYASVSGVEGDIIRLVNLAGDGSLYADQVTFSN